MSLLISGAIIGAATLIGSVEKSSKIDAQTEKKLSKAYQRQCDAQELTAQKQTQLDNSAMKLVNRKKAILATSIKDFISLYEKIIQINFVESDGVKEIEKSLMLKEEVVSMNHMVLATSGNISDVEAIAILLKGAAAGVASGAVVTGAGVSGVLTGTLLTGPVGILAATAALGHFFIEDSKRGLHDAKLQMRSANVVYSQAETVAVTYDGIIQRCDAFSSLLTKLNILFVRNIKQCNEIISKNLYDKTKYSIEERKVLMTCMNMASAIKKIIDVPIMDEAGNIFSEAEDALRVGQNYLEAINQIL